MLDALTQRVRLGFAVGYISSSHTSMALEAGDETYKSKTREGSMQQIRRTLADLEAKYGNSLGGHGTKRRRGTGQAAAASPEAAEQSHVCHPLRCGTKGYRNGRSVPHLSCFLAGGASPPAQAAGRGRTGSLHRPAAIRCPHTSSTRPGAARSRMGSLMPIVVLIDGESNYLVRANSWFFRSGKYRGQDIDPSFTNEPVERD